MINFKLSNLIAFSVAILGLILIQPQAYAAKHAKVQPAKAPQAQKERLVLMPLRVGHEIQNMLGAMETALAQGLQQQYTVFAGEDVAKKTREIFKKESAKKNCDETRCMEDIAIAFQSELIATANVTKIDGGYLLALSIRNVMDNKSVYNNSLPCEKCSAFQVVEKLKELSGASVPATAQTAAAPQNQEPQLKAKTSDAETDLWEQVQKGNTEEDYQAYMSAYPKGKYLALAKNRQNKIRSEAIAAAEQQEKQAWENAQQNNSIESYTDYLNAYSKGRFAALAQGRLTKLKKEQSADEAKQKREAAQASSAQPKAIKGETSVTPVMVRIPGRNYELGKYEVTQKEWQAVMGNNPSHFIACGENCPVEQVSWNDVQEFIQKLNAKTGGQYRLPTGTEWEYACRAGQQAEYCGGNDIDDVAWYNGNSGNQTHPVGQKQANGYGLHDMSGNVWEWQKNWYDSSQNERELRGGAWGSSLQYMGASFRNKLDATPRLNLIGLRLARTLP